MKNLVTAIAPFLLLLFCFQSAQAQDQIGKTEGELMRSMSTTFKDHLNFVRKEDTGGGVTYLVYSQVGKEDILKAYFLKNGKCVKYVVTYPIKYLSMVVKVQNEQYIRQSDNVWINKELTLKVTLSVNEHAVFLDFERI